MNDGTISGNKAGYCGGGVAIWTSGSFYMKGGTVSNNTAERQGGGVYVGSTPYVLHMKDVLVTDNTASILGGGMWLCPTGDAHTSVSNGALISGNSGPPLMVPPLVMTLRPFPKRGGPPRSRLRIERSVAVLPTGTTMATW